MVSVNFNWKKNERGFQLDRYVHLTSTLGDFFSVYSTSKRRRR